MNISYRKANKRDLDELYTLAVQFTEFNAKKSGKRRMFFYNGWKDSFRKEIIEDLSNPNNFYYLAIDKDKEDNKAIGYILSKRCRDLYSYCIEEFFVSPDYRKAHVGKTLLKLAIKKGKNLGLPIRVEIYNWNTNARKFYLSNGFKEDSTVFEYSK